MTLVGSGMGVTIVTNGSITIGAHGGTVRDLSLLGKDRFGTGLLITQKGLVTNATVACCDVSNWSRGIQAGSDGEQEWEYHCDSQNYRFSHLVVTNCGAYGGIFARGKILMDNCLLATNGAFGLYLYSGSFRAYNCTIADCYQSGYNYPWAAICAPEYDASKERIAVNCIFSGSKIAYRQSLNDGQKCGVFSNCLFNCEYVSCNKSFKASELAVTNDCVFGQDPQFSTSRRKSPYHLTAESPACRAGLKLEPVDALVPPSTETLDGKARGRFWDMGCYNDPKAGLSILVR